MLARVVNFSAWQMLGQIFSAGTLFVLAALLPAAPLAIFGLALSIGSLASTFITLRFEQAIVVAETDSQAHQLAWCATTSALVIALTTIAASQMPILSEYSLVLIAGASSALSLSAVSTSQQVLIRKNRSGRAGRVAVFRSLVTAVVVVAATLVGNRASANASLIGLITASVCVLLLCVFELIRIAPLGASFGDVKRTAKTYRDVWLPYLGQSVLSGVSLNAPYLVIYQAASPAMTASYLLADRIVRTPITMVSSSIRSHLIHQFRQLTAESGSHIEVTRIVRRWSANLACIGLAGFLTGGLLLVAATGLHGSDQWRLVGYAMLALAPWGSSVLSNPPAAAALTAGRRNVFILKAQVIELLLRLAILVVVLPVLEQRFFLALFLIHVPGIAYNVALSRKALAS